MTDSPRRVLAWRPMTNKEKEDLYKAYPKLDITQRAELSALLTAAGQAGRRQASGELPRDEGTERGRAFA
jgi:hypothetical protein